MNGSPEAFVPNEAMSHSWIRNLARCLPQLSNSPTPQPPNVCPCAGIQHLLCGQFVLLGPGSWRLRVAAACRTGTDRVKKSAPTSEPLAAIAEIVRFMMVPLGPARDCANRSN